MNKGRIWRCPFCYVGARAPQRMRRDDIRRYCLTCSSSIGRLTVRELGLAPRPKVVPRYSNPSVLMQKLRASNGAAISEPEVEAAVTCSRCTRGHGGLAKPCAVPECECFCNRSKAPPIEAPMAIAAGALPTAAEWWAEWERLGKPPLDVRVVLCRDCGAKSGYCKRPSGHKAMTAHASRWDDALRSIGGKL